MKLSVKLIALLTAGLLTMATVTACGKTTVEVPTVTAQPDSYEGLTPQQIYETLKKTDDFVFITVMDRQVEGATIAMTYMLEKDGDILRYTTHQDAEDDRYDASSVIYIDFKETICIVPSGDEWYILDEDSEKFSLETLIKNCTPVDLLFKNGNYSTAGGQYRMTEEALLSMIGSTSATVSGKMTEKDGNYTFEVVTKEAGNTVTLTTKVLFRNVSVVMPSYNTNTPGQTGAVTTVTTTTPQTPDESTSPAVTTAPEGEEN